MYKIEVEIIGVEIIEVKMVILTDFEQYGVIFIKILSNLYKFTAMKTK